MKIRLICVLFLVVMIFFGWDTIKSEFQKTEDQYNVALDLAHEQVSLGINEKAYANYLSALDVRESFDLRLEMVSFLHDTGAVKSFEKELKKMLEMYPKEVRAYEYVCEYAIESGNISGLYSYRDQMHDRGVQSEMIEALCESHKYDYYLSKSSYLKIDPFFYGYSRVYSDEGYIGYIDSFGTQWIGANYSVAAPYTGIEMFMVKDKENQTIYLDLNGEKSHVDAEKRNMDFEDIGGYCNNSIPVCQNGKYRYIDYYYNDIIPEKTYNYASMLYGGIAAVRTDAGWILIDSNQEQVGNKVFDDIKVNENGVAVIGGYVAVKSGDSWYLANSNGDFIGNDKYEDMCFPCDFNGEQPIAVKKDGKWGFIDGSGIETLGCQYDNARSFVHGIAAVEIDGLWTLIDLNGNKIMEPQFKGAYEMTSSGTVPVLTDKGWRLLIFYSMN